MVRFELQFVDEFCTKECSKQAQIYPRRLRVHSNLKISTSLENWQGMKSLFQQGSILDSIENIFICVLNLRLKLAFDYLRNKETKFIKQNHKRYIVRSVQKNHNKLVYLL